MRGKFITLEGPDGAGKSTQVKLLAQYFSSRGLKAVVTREPGGTPVAEKIREILLNPENQEMTNRTEVLLYAAARAQHVEELIEPALTAGEMVICDRFIDSTLAYQGYGRGWDLDFLQKVNQIATGGWEPDLTILLDVPSELGIGRIYGNRKSGGDRLEQQDFDFHRRVRQGYLELAEKFPKRIKVVSAQEPVDVVWQVVQSLADRLLGLSPVR